MTNATIARREGHRVLALLDKPIAGLTRVAIMTALRYETGDRVSVKMAADGWRLM
jgi:hypothetical protein